MRGWTSRGKRTIRSALTIGLACLLCASSVPAASQRGGESRAEKSKTGKARTKADGKVDRRTHRSIRRDEDGIAEATLTLALENYRTMLSVIAHNMANAETPGYKRAAVVWEDLEYREEILPGMEDPSGRRTANGLSVGSGSRIAGTTVDFRQGRLTHTGRELDLAIRGEGFFQLKDPSGTIYYCRAGHFSLNANGEIVAASAHAGRALEPGVVVPSDATRIVISPDGAVSCRSPGNTALTRVGSLQLATFANLQGLRRLGENLYEETEASGSPTVGTPGSNGFGRLQQGWIEASNVDLSREISEWKRVRRICRTLGRIVNGERRP